MSEEEDLIFCPLDCGARIKNLGKHFKKCKNYNLLGIKYRLCEYNATHIIKNELYQIHLLSCKSKKKFQEDENESIDDDLDDKFSDSSENEEKKEEKEKKKYEEKKEDSNIIINVDNKIDNEENNTYKKKRRYRHEKALFRDENEIDQESLDFFNKVYV